MDIRGHGLDAWPHDSWPRGTKPCELTKPAYSSRIVGDQYRLGSAPPSSQDSVDAALAQLPEPPHERLGALRDGERRPRGRLARGEVDPVIDLHRYGYPVPHQLPAVFVGVRLAERANAPRATEELGLRPVADNPLEQFPSPPRPVGIDADDVSVGVPECDEQQLARALDEAPALVRSEVQVVQTIVSEHRVDVAIAAAAGLASSSWHVCDVDVPAQTRRQLLAGVDLGAHDFHGGRMLRGRELRSQLTSDVNAARARRDKSAAPVPVHDQQLH